MATPFAVLSAIRTLCAFPFALVSTACTCPTVRPDESRTDAAPSSRSGSSRRDSDCSGACPPYPRVVWVAPDVAALLCAWARPMGRKTRDPRARQESLRTMWGRLLHPQSLFIRNRCVAKPPGVIWQRMQDASVPGVRDALGSL